MTNKHPDSFSSYRSLDVNGKQYAYYDLNSKELKAIADIDKLPNSIKVLLENLLRKEDNKSVTKDDIVALAQSAQSPSNREIAYYPARVLMQDFTGVPAVVDLAAMRDALASKNIDPEKINPLSPVDLVIDHSVVVDRFASDHAFSQNVALEMERNGERYEFLKWGQKAFSNFGLVPPGTGICHQVNLEYISKCVWSSEIDGELTAYPDTLVGTDSHTTMVNGLGVLGWGVGGIEAEGGMLGEPISMLIPEVVGFELVGSLNEGITATDLVLRIVQMLREHGVVGKFVEFYGSGLDAMPLADRATIANMAPEYGATCGFFPVDEKTLDYLHLSGRDQETIDLVESYSKAQGMWRDSTTPAPVFSSTLHLDMSEVKPNLAGPKRPQDRVSLEDLSEVMEQFIRDDGKGAEIDKDFACADGFDINHGDVVIAAITSCTNTSNPAVMVGAGLLARKAIAKGLKTKPWVKTSLAPGSQVVTEYLEKSALLDPLEALGFHVVGYGCTTCIGNSGPLPEAVHNTVSENDMVVSSVLSGNRNFEGRIHALVKANWLASPPLVVAYALAGNTRINLSTEPLGEDADGNPVYLKDVWPSNDEIAEEIAKIDRNMFIERYADVFSGDQDWQSISVAEGKTFDFSERSTYIQSPPFFADIYTQGKDQNVQGARVLALLGDSVTTDHISPAGAIAKDSPAGRYLIDKGVAQKDFNSYGSRRGNHEVMMRGTFANIRIRNELVPGTEGGYTRMPDDETPIPIYDAAMRYIADNQPTVVIAGKEYGTGSSRDWAAKGTLLLGVKAVIVESFERIHRSNLVRVGVLPLQFKPGDTRQSLNIGIEDRIDILGLDQGIEPQQEYQVNIHRADGSVDTIKVDSRIDTSLEVDYYLSGGVLPYVLNRLV